MGGKIVQVGGGGARDGKSTTSRPALAKRKRKKAVHGRQKNLTQRRRGRRGNGDRPGRVECREETNHGNEPAEYPISNTEDPISKERSKENRHSDAFPIRSPRETPREPSSLQHWQLAVGYSIWRFVLPPLGQNPVNAHPEMSHCILLLSSSASSAPLRDALLEGRERLQRKHAA